MFRYESVQTSDHPVFPMQQPDRSITNPIDPSPETETKNKENLQNCFFSVQSIISLRNVFLGVVQQSEGQVEARGETPQPAPRTRLFFRRRWKRRRRRWWWRRQRRILVVFLGSSGCGCCRGRCSRHRPAQHQFRLERHVPRIGSAPRLHAGTLQVSLLVIFLRPTLAN